MEQLKKLTVIIMLILFTLLSCNAQVIAADLTKTKGSLTIIRYETGASGHEGENTPLQGAKYSIYKVADDAEPTMAVPATGAQTGTTGSNGKVVFSNLDLGRYLVVETEVPANVTSKITNFVVDIPQTTVNGTDLEYDVTVEPKSNSAYGTITLTKQGVDGAKQSGVSFVLQKENASNVYVDYPDTAHSTLSTNTDGQITVENLPVGDYRFVETNLGSNTGYILDNQTEYTFTVSLNASTNLTEVSPSSITVNGEKPDLTKQISKVNRNTSDTNTVKVSGSGIYADPTSVAGTLGSPVGTTTNAITSGTDAYTLDIGDIVTYKVEADIPSTITKLATYEIATSMDTGLTLAQNEIVVKIGETTFVKDTDYTLVTDANSFKVTFNDTGKAKLNGNSKVEIDYMAVLNSNANSTTTGNTDRTNLKYSDVVKTNYKGENNTETPVTTENKSATVYTGGLIIEKRADSATGALLQGAVFKLASTEAKAKAGTYIKDSNGTEITLTTNASGLATYKGLSYGNYYLVEVQAPEYETGKYYNLLNKPVKITVNSTTSESNKNVVINKKPTILPKTGAFSTMAILIVGLVFVIIAIKQNKKRENVPNK